ncbi:MAG: heme-binding protein [Hyphomicrobium sp.]
MRTRLVIVAGLGLSLLSGAVSAAEPAAAPANPPAAPAPVTVPNPLDDVPEAMPFAQPYGAPISLAKALALIQGATAEASKRGWQMSFAVLDSSATPVAFARMDGANLASASIAGEKAATAVKFRRPTRVFEDAIQKKDFKYLLSLQGILASRGGLPLLEDGKVIGAIGCSGGTGSQDEAVCLAAAAAYLK